MLNHHRSLRIWFYWSLQMICFNHPCNRETSNCSTKKKIIDRTVVCTVGNPTICQSTNGLPTKLFLLVHFKREKKIVFFSFNDVLKLKVQIQELYFTTFIVEQAEIVSRIDQLKRRLKRRRDKKKMAFFFVYLSKKKKQKKFL